MRRLPVPAVIREAYGFTFTHLGAIIALIWLPMVIVTVGDFFVTQNYSLHAQQLMAGGNAAAAGPAVLVQLGFLVARLVLYAMMYVSVAQLALDQRQGGTMVHFAFGRPEWRMFRALLGLLLLFFLAAIVLSLMVGVTAAETAVTPRLLLSEIGALLFLLGLTFLAVRMGFLLPAVVTAEDGPVLARCWLLSEGNFWRLLGVLLACVGPLGLLLMMAMMVLIGGSIDPHAPQTADSLSALAATNLPLTAGLQFLVAPLLLGLSVGASVFSYRALNRTDLSA